jgi:hypothetical protein
MIHYNFFENKGFSQREQKLVRSFDTYLETTADKEIVVFTSHSADHFEFHIPYPHRWSESYRKKMITQMYGVEEYITHRTQSPIITLLTLTGYQDGTSSINHVGTPTSRAQLFEKLKTGCHLILDNIRTLAPDIPYIWIMEPHKSGYPHIHIALFGYISPKIQKRLAKLWTDKYNIGSKKHGINFQVSSVKESIKSIKNYLLKYISKSIGSNGRKSWSPEEFLYHATAWKHHHRFIGMARSISRYCTARKLRHRFIKRLADLSGQYVKLPPPHTDKDQLTRDINYYKQLTGVDPPDPSEHQWHYSFCINKGTPSLIHHKNTQPNNSKVINLVNYRLAQILQYNDSFIQPPENKQS